MRVLQERAEAAENGDTAEFSTQEKFVPATETAVQSE